MHIDKNNSLTPSQLLHQGLEAPHYRQNFLDRFNLPETMDVTVVIPTYNRCPYDPRKPGKKLNPLYWNLSSIINQRPKLKEIIVINDCSHDYTVDLLKRMRTRARENDIKFIVFQRKKRRGSSSARNIGVKRATSNFIFFTDDDTIASKYSIFGALHTLKKLSQEGVKVGAIHLPVYDRSTFPAGVIKADKIARLNFDKGRYSSYFNKFPREYLKNTEKFLDDKYKILKPIQIQNLAGCFLSPKKRFLTVNGFPDFFTWKNSYGEETELGCRLMANGYSLFFCPDPKFGLYHGKFGESAKIPVNRKLLRKHRNKKLVDNIPLSQINKECAQPRENTGNRVTVEEWYYSKIISFFVIFYPRNMKGALAWMAYTRKVFVEKNRAKKFTRGKWAYIKEKDKRESIWYKAILDGLELVTKKDKSEVWDFLRGLEEIRDFRFRSKLGFLHSRM